MRGAFESERTKDINQTLRIRAGSRDESKVTCHSNAFDLGYFQKTEFQFLTERPALNKADAESHLHGGLNCFAGI